MTQDIFIFDEDSSSLHVFSHGGFWPWTDPGLIWNQMFCSLLQQLLCSALSLCLWSSGWSVWSREKLHSPVCTRGCRQLRVMSTGCELHTDNSKICLLHRGWREAAPRSAGLGTTWIQDHPQNFQSPHIEKKRHLGPSPGQGPGPRVLMGDYSIDSRSSPLSSPTSLLHLSPIFLSHPPSHLPLSLLQLTPPPFYYNFLSHLPPHLSTTPSSLTLLLTFLPHLSTTPPPLSSPTFLLHLPTSPPPSSPTIPLTFLPLYYTLLLPLPPPPHYQPAFHLPFQQTELSPRECKSCTAPHYTQ